MTHRDLPQPVTSPVHGEPGLYQLREALHVPVGPFLLVTPAGAMTDGASIPRIAWPLIGHPMRGDYQAAAISHDWLYCEQEVPRVVADALFCAVLRNYGVPRRRTALMYAAVRAFGWMTWRRRRRHRGRPDWGNTERDCHGD